MYASTFLLVILVVLGVSHAALDKPIPDDVLSKVFSAYDCDHSGKLSLKEAEALGAAYGTDKATIAKEFQAADKEDDDQLSFEEYKAAINSGCCSVKKVPDAPKPCSQ